MAAVKAEVIPPNGSSHWVAFCLSVHDRYNSNSGNLL